MRLEPRELEQRGAKVRGTRSARQVHYGVTVGV